MDIEVSTGGLKLKARLFDNEPARSLYQMLPVETPATVWGREFYGSLPGPLAGAGSELSATVEPGGIAYSEQGNYLCIFYGQSPAWPVDIIGRIENWQPLLELGSIHSFKVAALD